MLMALRFLCSVFLYLLHPSVFLLFISPTSVSSSSFSPLVAFGYTSYLSLLLPHWCWLCATPSCVCVCVCMCTCICVCVFSAVTISQLLTCHALVLIPPLSSPIPPPPPLPPSSFLLTDGPVHCSTSFSLPSSLYFSPPDLSVFTLQLPAASLSLDRPLHIHIHPSCRFMLFDICWPDNESVLSIDVSADTK